MYRHLLHSCSSRWMYPEAWPECENSHTSLLSLSDRWAITCHNFHSSWLWCFEGIEILLESRQYLTGWICQLEVLGQFKSLTIISGDSVGEICSHLKNWQIFDLDVTEALTSALFLSLPSHIPSPQRYPMYQFKYGCPTA